MASEETTPLLNGQAASTANFSEPEGSERWTSRFKKEWPVIRILLAFSIWNLAIFGPLPARIDRLRGFVCADFYYSHPDLISEAFDIRQSPCTIPKIERKLSTFTLLLDLTHALAAALGLLVYSSLISTKGRKPVFLIGNLAGLFHLLPYALLPLGYPFTSKTEAGLLNPRTSLYLLYTFSLLAGLLAFEDLAPLVSKALLADISSPQNRMRNLTWLLLAMLISVSLGPILFSAIIEFLPPLTASSLIGEPVDLSSHNNILPFLVGMLLQVASALWISLLVPETVGLRDVEKPTPHTSTETSHPSRLSVLSILLPKKIPLQDSSSSVQKDWRLTRLTLVGQAGIAGSMGLQSLILFVGYLGWTAADVGIIISWMGTVRALVLILLVPSTLAWLSRIVKKPKELSDLSSEEMERIGKAPLELEEILEREDELEEDITSHQQVEGESEVIEAEAQELSEMQENLERDESLRKQLSLWKANVDLLLLKGSFFLDAVGWIITFLGAQSLQALPLYIGGVFVSFGVAANGAMISVGIAIVTDMYNRGYDVGDSLQQATDRLLGAITFTEAIGRAHSPIISTIIYQASLSTFPGASFLYSSLMYGIALALLLGVRAERV